MKPLKKLLHNPMIKTLLWFTFLGLLLLLTSCSKEYNWKYHNTYLVFKPGADSIYVFYPERGKYLYDQSVMPDRYNLKDFVKIKNGDGFKIELSDSLKVTTKNEVDIIYFPANDLQDWRRYGNTWSLKIGELSDPTLRGYYEVDLTDDTEL